MKVYVGKGKLADKGVYAACDFQKGEAVIQYNLKALSQEEYEQLPDPEKMFTHVHWGQIYLYGEPERFVNHSSDPNTMPDLVNKCDIAIKDIRKGEMITTDSSKDDIK